MNYNRSDETPIYFTDYSYLRAGVLKVLAEVNPLNGLPGKKSIQLLLPNYLGTFERTLEAFKILMSSTEAVREQLQCSDIDPHSKFHLELDKVEFTEELNVAVTLNAANKDCYNEQ